MRVPEHPPVESAQFVCGCREVGEGAGECPHVVVEHLPDDVVDVDMFLDAGGEADTVICPGIGATRKSSSGIEIFLGASAVQ